MQSTTTPAKRRQPTIPTIRLPMPPAPALTAQQVGVLMKRARKLRNNQRITAYDFGVFDALMFQCRNPRSGTVEVSYSALQRITGFARSTITQAITRLGECSLVVKIKRRLRMAWHQGGTTSRQATNCYQFDRALPSNDTEFAGRPVHKGLEISYISKEVNVNAEAARAVLAEGANERAQRRAEAWRAERAAKAKAGWITAY